MRPFRAPFSLYCRTESIVLGLTAFSLCRSPLTGALAYEFSFLLGIAASLIATFGAALRLSEIERSRPLSRADLTRALAASQILLLLPLGVVLAYSFKIATCRWDVGFAWFALLPMISSFFGSASACWAFTSPGSRMSHTFRAFIPTLLFSLLTLRDLASDPPLFFLHPAFGYFAGPIYDEWIPIPSSVITFRFWTLALSLWLASTAYLSIARKNPIRRAAWLLPGILVCSAFFLRTQLGWFYGAKQVRSELSATVEKGFLRLHFDPAAPSIDFDSLANTLDFRARQVADQLGLSDDQRKPIDIFVYRSAEQKRRLTVTRYTAIGNPLQRAVHLLHPDPRSTTLPHELTHVLAAPFGIPGLGLTFRVGLLEGIATAMEKYREDLSIHEWARALQILRLLPSVEEVLSPLSFFRQAPSRAYLASGSFCRWLIDQRGIYRFQQLYRGRSFERVYGRSSSSLVKAWENFLATIPVTSETVSRIEDRLRQRSIFERRCPHDVADADEKGWRCIRTSDWTGASEAFERAWQYAGKSSDRAISLARTEARQGRWNRVESLAKSVVADSRSSPSDLAWGQIYVGDAAVVRDEQTAAADSYARVQASAVDPDIGLAVQARLHLLQEGETDSLLRLIQRGPDEKWVESMIEARATPPHPSAPLLLYAARAAAKRGNLSVARRILSQVPSDPGADLERIQRALEAEIFEKQRDDAHAIEAYERLGSRASAQGEILRAEDQIARLRWLASAKPGE